MNRSFCLVLMTMALGGCVQNDYDLELVPAGKSLERKLTVTRHGGNADVFSPPEAQRLAKEYDMAPPAPAKEHVFRGRFSGLMPVDVGGYGTFTRWETPLGSVHVYVERFRGNDDAAGLWQRRQRAADRLVELLATWLEREMRGDLQRPGLRQFLEVDFRRDLYNISLYVWTLGLGEQSEDFPASLMRALQYLVERGYFTPDDLPAIRRAIDDAGRDDYQRLIALASPMILSRLPGDPQPALESFTTPERLARSLRAFLETTEEYQKLEREWQKALETDINAARPDSLDVASELVSQLFMEGLFQLGGDRLTVGLKTSRPPIITNGQWSADSATIKWSPKSVPGEGLPPAFAYAVWDEPDEAAQRLHFGMIVLQEKMLFDYCTWYRGLTERERREWDALIGTLQPGPQLISDLEAFRFSDEPAGGDKNKRLATSMIESIAGELKRGS